MLITRTTLNDVQSKIDELEFVESQIVEKVIPIGNFKTNLNNKFTTTYEGSEKELTEDSRNQILGIGKFGVTSFKDCGRVMIPIKDMTTKLNAQIFMLNSVNEYADKTTYKHQFYEDKLTSVTNPNHPNLAGITLFRELFDQIAMKGLTPMVYDLSFDPISGRQSLELVFGENVSRANLRKNDSIATGIKISNNINGHGHFRVQIYAVQLVCTNGMIAPVSVGGFKGLHRSKWDLLGKIAKWLKEITGRYYNFRDFNAMFYSDLAGGIIELASRQSSVIKSALERAMTVPLLETPKKVFEKLAKKESLITKKDVDHLISIYYSDPTIDRENPSMVNIVQSITRHANSESLSPTKREDLQELAYVIATR